MKNIFYKIIQRKFLLRLIVVIAVLICIPLIIFQIMMMEQTTKTFERMNTDHVISEMAQNYNFFYEQVDSLTHAGIRIMQDNDIRKAAKPGASEYAIYVAATTLKNYNKSILSSYKLGLYLRGKNKVIYDGYAMKLQMFCMRLSDNSISGTENIEKTFKDIGTITVFSTANYAEIKKATIVIMKPISILSTLEDDAVVFFTFSHDDMQKTYAEKISGCVSVALVDPECNFIMRGDTFDKIFEEEKFKEFLYRENTETYTSDALPDITVFKYAGENSIFLTAVQNNFGLSLENYVKNIRNLTIISFGLICILFAAAIYLIYKPIYRLVKKHAFDKDGKKFLSETELIDSVIFAADQKLISLQEMLEENIIGDILYGTPVDKITIEKVFGNCEYKEFMVLRIQREKISSTNAIKIQDSLHLKTGCKFYITGLPRDSYAIFIALSNEPIDAALISECVREAMQEINGSDGEICTGMVVHSIKMLRESYLKAFLGKDMLLYSTDDNINIGVDFSDIFRKFTESIMMSDKETANKILNEIRGKFERFAKAERYEMYYAYKLLSIYLTTTKKCSLPQKELNDLLNFTDINDLFDKLKRSVSMACDRLCSLEQMNDLKIEQKLLNYVDANFCDRNLCLITAAEYMETSIYVISRMFKEIAGVNFKEYVMEKRLKLALELLTASKLTVSAIAKQVGFDNPAYFSTVFKARYGITPLKARKVYLKGDL